LWEVFWLHVAAENRPTTRSVQSKRGESLSALHFEPQSSTEALVEAFFPLIRLLNVTGRIVATASFDKANQ
jgi:hypothetical protein